MPTILLPEHIKQHILNNAQNHCEINSQELFDEHVAIIVELLNQRPLVKVLELGQTNITDKGIIELNKLLHVENLCLKRGNFGDVGAVALVNNPKFKALNFHGNRSITDVTAEVVIKESMQTSLIVSDTSISYSYMELIAEKLMLNRDKARVSPAKPVTTSQRFFEEKKVEERNYYMEILQKAQADRQSVSFSPIRRL